MPRCTVMLKLRQLIFSMLGTWWRLIKVITLLVQCFWKCYDQMHNYWCWRCHIRLGISHRRCLSHSRGRTILQHVHFYGYQIIEQLSIHNFLILQRWTTKVRKIPALFSLLCHLRLIIAGVQSCVHYNAYKYGFGPIPFPKLLLGILTIKYLILDWVLFSPTKHQEI